MIPDTLTTNNNLTIREPIKIELSIHQDTMIWGGMIAAAVLVTALKFKK